jgi:hypothetical protein
VADNGCCRHRAYAGDAFQDLFFLAEDILNAAAIAYQVSSQYGSYIGD